MVLETRDPVGVDVVVEINAHLVRRLQLWPQAPAPQQEASVHDLLRSIQNQMVLQTIQMGKLAEKDDLR